ncbi:hypothetical protein JCM5353_001446 [Sporobolomyces roseus]
MGSQLEESTAKEEQKLGKYGSKEDLSSKVKKCQSQGKRSGSTTEISIRDFCAAIKGEGSSHGTPAPVSRPGFFSHSTPRTQTNSYRSPVANTLLSRSTSLAPDSVNRPRSSLANSNNDVFRADTLQVDDFPDSGFGEAPQSMNDTPGGDKKWFNPKNHFQKPFKFPTPVRRTSPALEYGPSKVIDKGKGPRMQDQAEDGVGDSDEEAVEEERRREEPHAKREKAKGKSSRADEMARMVMERNNRNKGKIVARDHDEGGEGVGEERNLSPPGSSPHQEQDEPTPPKERKVDNESQAVLRKPRVSAADLALSRSISTCKSSSVRSSTSVDKKQPTPSRAQPPQRSSSTVASSDHEKGQIFDSSNLNRSRQGDQDRFLAPLGLTTSHFQQQRQQQQSGFDAYGMPTGQMGGGREGSEDNVKMRAVQLVDAGRTLMRIPLIPINIAVVIYEILFG